MAHGSICRPDLGRPRKVVSGRVATKLNKSVVSLEHSRNLSYGCFLFFAQFVIENEINEDLQKWNFISSTT